MLIFGWYSIQVFPSNNLEKYPGFCPGICPGIYARAKEKGGGVTLESVGVVWVCPLFLPGQNGNGFLSCLRFCPGIWMGAYWMGFGPGTWIWMGFCPGIWMRCCPGTWMRFFPGIDLYGGIDLDGGIWMGFCNHGILPYGTSFDNF